jgi:hypothetical protein
MYLDLDKEETNKMVEERTTREERDDIRADRGDILLDRMDGICDKLTDKLGAMAITLNTVDIRLGNHLAHHDKFEKYFLYPIALAILLAAGSIIWKMILN